MEEHHGGLLTGHFPGPLLEKVVVATYVPRLDGPCKSLPSVYYQGRIKAETDSIFGTYLC